MKIALSTLEMLVELFFFFELFWRGESQSIIAPLEHHWNLWITQSVSHSIHKWEIVVCASLIQEKQFIFQCISDNFCFVFRSTDNTIAVARLQCQLNFVQRENRIKFNYWKSMQTMRLRRISQTYRCIHSGIAFVLSPFFLFLCCFFFHYNSYFDRNRTFFALHSISGEKFWDIFSQTKRD